MMPANVEPATGRVDHGDPRAGVEDTPVTGAPGTAELIAIALEAAINLRAPHLLAATPMVCELSRRMCLQLGLDARQQRLVQLCARVRDVGMLGLPDGVVTSSGPLTPDQWEMLNRHPVLGAELLERVPGLGVVAEIVRAHHERWDGAGYPEGLSGEAIPVLSRIIATADAFVAIATDRPHRRAAGTDVALEHIAQQRGAQFDPRAIDALFAVLDGRSSSDVVRTDDDSGHQQSPHRGARAGSRLGRALMAFDVIPAFGPACDKALAAIRAESAGAGMVSAIESDTGLTVAVLRGANRLDGRRSIANVPDAVAALGDKIENVIATVPRASFPWRTPQEALLYELCVHSQTVARAADRIADEIEFQNRDELIAASLLHDVGKLVLAKARPVTAPVLDPRATSPEQRVQAERRELKLDHASAGALLTDRWGLPERLSTGVGAHHSSDGSTDVATLVRLGDLVARHAHGDAIDRRVMLRLANACQLSVAALREVLFDLPQSGSQRRRAEPSPLSNRETTALRQLATGKIYSEIAQELGVSASTVRSHLHSVYKKLEVTDRAQAVLRATEMGWI